MSKHVLNSSLQLMYKMETCLRALCIKQVNHVFVSVFVICMLHNPFLVRKIVNCF